MDCVYVYQINQFVCLQNRMEARARARATFGSSEAHLHCTRAATMICVLWYVHITLIFDCALTLTTLRLHMITSAYIVYGWHIARSVIGVCAHTRLLVCSMLIPIRALSTCLRFRVVVGGNNMSSLRPQMPYTRVDVMLLRRSSSISGFGGFLWMFGMKKASTAHTREETRMKSDGNRCQLAPVDLGSRTESGKSSKIHFRN